MKDSYKERDSKSERDLIDFHPLSFRNTSPPKNILNEYFKEPGESKAAWREPIVELAHYKVENYKDTPVDLNPMRDLCNIQPLHHMDPQYYQFNLGNFKYSEFAMKNMDIDQFKLKNDITAQFEDFYDNWEINEILQVMVNHNIIHRMNEEDKQ